MIAEIHGSTHAAFPIRDMNGMADGIVDLNTGKLKILPRHEGRDMQRLLRLLQRAYSELNMISLGEDAQCVLGKFTCFRVINYVNKLCWTTLCAR